ncbi:hypothetical protein CBS147339_8485 [Penicillium roqueforti]|nr:hypothetical protein DTO013F2_8752 [Penicillium roqueforti]KAI2767151.1 hypothetical protein DTO012A8_7648 [Penicillium roqueforti]KAI3067530.1 hypothetical protein CBS147339_8485 [Penicillium roqueforti]KAI3152957.1 hypothetical protein DTO046C5_8877 [Penicillium roqueforti]
MSNASFRLESFRPWNPFQDKAQPLRDSLDICRYPSPVSMTPTPPPSNPIDPVSKNQKSHSHKPGRHPLPARPPLEVCLDDGLHSDAQTTRHEPEDLGRTTFTSPHAETFDSEDLLQMQDLRSTEDIDSTTIPDNVCLGAEHRSSGFGSCDSDPAVLAGQHLPGNEAIDPAILDDHAFPGVSSYSSEIVKYEGNALGCSYSKVEKGEPTTLSFHGLSTSNESRCRDPLPQQADKPMKGWQSDLIAVLSPLDYLKTGLDLE